MAGRTAAGQGFATFSNLEMQHSPKIFCIFLQKVLAKNKDQLYFRNIALALNYIYDHDKYKAAVKRGDKRIVYKNKKYEKQAKKREQRAALRRVDQLFDMIEKERKEKENVAFG